MKTDYRFANLAKLNDESCKIWARLPYWTPLEALCLSMNLDLDTEEYHITDYDYADHFGEKYFLLERKLSRDTAIGKIKYIPRIDEDGEEYIEGYSPSEFLKWADDNIPSFPENLRNAVVHSLQNLAISGQTDLPEVTNKQDSDDEGKKRLLLDSLKLKGVNTDLILDCVTTVDLHCLNGLITPPEKPDPVNVAEKNEKNRRLKVQAVNFMLQQIKSDCLCNHVNLAQVALDHKGEWADIPKAISHDKLKELSKLIVPPNRRLISNQHTKSPLYDSSACKCQIPGH
jgi:hypothetical protein